MADELAESDYYQELNRRVGARAPATYGELWHSEWQRAGLDTIGGIGRPLTEAVNELSTAVEREAGSDLGTYASEKNVPLGSAVTIDQRIRLLNELADTLPEDGRKRIDPLRDARSRASDKARDIERNASDVAEGTYGMTGTAVSWAAGVARQSSDFASIVANLATAPVGGPFKGPILTVLARQGFAGALGQAVVEPYIESARSELGLEGGLGRGAMNVLEAGVSSAGLAGVFRAGAFGLRMGYRGLTGRDIPVLEPGTPPIGDTAGERLNRPIQTIKDFYNRMRRDIAPEDLDAAATLAERDQALDASRPGVEQAPRIDEAAAALEVGRPINTVEPINAKFSDDTTRYLVRPGGARLEVKPAIVELGDLIVSHDMEGRPNPAYPAELQPRDRAAPASRTWVAEKAAELEPALLGEAPTAGLGAPVIGPDGVVESGNGRVMLIARAYDRHPERAQAYRAMLAAQGYDVADMQHPVLVRVRQGELGMAERAALATEANVSPTAGMSTRKRAVSDAQRLDSQLLSTWHGGSVASAENAPFVRAFADRVVAPEERPQFIGEGDRLSAEGLRRIEAALVQRAWSAPDVVSALYESTDASSRAILGAMADTAPAVSRLRAAVEEGRVPAEADPTPALLEAYRLVDRARGAGLRVGDVLDQIDIERGAVPEDVREAVKLYFRDDGLRQAAGREVVAERIQKAADRALEHENALADLFGVKPTAANALRQGKLAGLAPEDMPVGSGMGRDELARMIERKAAPAEIGQHPLVIEANRYADALPETKDLPGYGTPEFERTREFSFPPRIGEGPPVHVIGYEAAIRRLEQTAKDYAGGEPLRERRAILIIGPPAAGKSAHAEHYAREFRAAIVDPDDAKKPLPEYDGGVGAPAVHRESATIANEVEKRLLREGVNVVRPTVGAKPDVIVSMTLTLQNQGYRVGLVNVAIEPDEAYRRMINRFLMEGRIISNDYFMGIGKKPTETYIKLRDGGLYDDVAEIDANGPRPGRVTDGAGELARRSRPNLERRDVADLARARGGAEGERIAAATEAAARTEIPALRDEAARIAAAAEPAARQLGDPVKAAEYERVLAELGDFEVALPDGSARSASGLISEIEDDARAVRELELCIGEAA
jgi:hypothetical protein